MEKGPDIFLNVVEKISKEKDVHVLLGGWRRQYVIAGLEKMKVKRSMLMTLWGKWGQTGSQAFQEILKKEFEVFLLTFRRDVTRQMFAGERVKFWTCFWCTNSIQKLFKRSSELF